MDTREDEGDREGEDEGTRKGPPAAPHRPCLYSIKGLFKKATGVRTLASALGCTRIGSRIY